MGECTDSNGGNFYSEASTRLDRTSTDDRSKLPRCEMTLRYNRHLLDHLFLSVGVVMGEEIDAELVEITAYGPSEHA